MFASNISTIHLVGLAAAGASLGIVMGNFEWLASFCLIALALFFAPFYFRSLLAVIATYAPPINQWVEAFPFGKIHLLPALPKQWATGPVSGLRVRGGYVVDIDWKDG